MKYGDEGLWILVGLLCILVGSPFFAFVHSGLSQRFETDIRLLTKKDLSPADLAKKSTTELIGLAKLANETQEPGNERLIRMLISTRESPL